MTAPLFHLTPGALDDVEPGSVLVLDGAEGHHAATVMRLGEGEPVQLSDTARTRADAVVSAAEAGQLQLRISTVVVEEVQRPRLVLVQGLAKDRRDLQAIESATELGVDAVIPWTAERSVARWKPGREAKKHAEWVSTVTAASKQTRRTSIPEVRQLHTTAQYLAALTSGTGVVVLHEAERVSLRTALQALGLGSPPARGAEAGAQVSAPSASAGTAAAEPAELHLVVGPEGGISDQEVQRLSAAGARTARLGRHVLRSSTAGPAAVAGVQLLLGRWDW